jgi:glycosyltransferase involved in cell wall biosynthesis
LLFRRLKHSKSVPVERSHMTQTRAAAYELGIICYPFFPTRDSGRGVDRYLYELVQNRPEGARAAWRVLEQGREYGTLASGSKAVVLAKQVLSARAAVYLAVSPPAGAAAIAAGKRNVVVVIHDLLPFQVAGYNPSFKNAFVRRCIELCIARAAALIVPFAVTRDALVKEHGADPRKIHVVNYGVDHAAYQLRPSVARNERRVLYVGELNNAKGVDVLLDAFARVQASVPDAELVIGGKGRDAEALKAQASSLGLRHVDFRGFVPEAELADLYASAAAMVFPSRYGFGLSSLEAMACGTPVVVAKTLDAPEFIRDAGLLVSPGDASELARGIERILITPTLAQELQHKGTARAAEYSWRRTAAETQAVCDLVRDAVR